MFAEARYGYRHANHGDGWVISHKRPPLVGWGWYAYGPWGGTYGEATSEELAREAAMRTRDQQRELSGRTG